MLAILLENQHRQKAGARPSSWHDVEWCRRLRDLLAIAARDLLAHRLDHLPRSRDHLECLGHILTLSSEPQI